MTDAATSGSPDQAITDERLGVFARDAQTLSDGGVLYHSFCGSMRDPDGREIVLMLDTADPQEARRLLPRLHGMAENLAVLERRAIEAVVCAFTKGPPTADDYADARDDLALDTIAVEDGDEIVLHFTDSCGRHFLDGYWPAVRFDRDDTVLDVTVEA
ncbi:hypothetical protein [Actinomadura nitritigenes]|uniref:hypothetical protein n=1 Tax=Actinomadura nitritigenes TaxID=134602 RepID=UPI003D8F132B